LKFETLILVKGKDTIFPDFHSPIAKMFYEMGYLLQLPLLSFSWKLYIYHGIMSLLFILTFFL
jgi:hypothetical protein